MSQVSELDYVTIRGYDNGRESKVYSITIEKGHGTLTINNYNKINDGMIQLNDAEPIPLSSTGTMDILEGKYTITITGSNCEPFKDDIVITPTAPFTLDLSDIQIKSGVLNVTANVNDYTITIDGTDYPTGEPILLDYGKYEVKINKEDYDTYTGTVTIDQDINTFNAQLKETVKYGTANITVNPGSAKIYIDGVLAGVSPQSKKVAVGSHTITIKLDGYIDEARNIYISGPDDVVNESFDLTPQVSAYVTTE